MVLDTEFPPDSRVENEAVSLIQAGHEVYLFSLNYGTHPGYEEINGIHVHRYPSNQIEYKSSALAYTLPFYHNRMRRKIADFIRKLSPDVLHVHDLTVAKAALDAAAGAGIPAVLDLHENRPVIMQEYVHVKKFPGKYLINPSTWTAWQNRLAGKADRLVLVTDEACDDLAGESGVSRDKMISVPNTVTLSIYDNYRVDMSVWSEYENNFVLLYMGDTGLRRGTDTLIQAMPAILQEIPEARLILVGSNTEDIQLHALVEELGLKSEVVFEGWQDVSRFPSYVAAADLCFSPLKRNRHHDTTFANKIFQYMAGGKPLVVSDCPPQAHVVESSRCGMVHPADDPVALAGVVKKLYLDKEECGKMGDNARKAVEQHWNWKETSKSLIQMYESFADPVPE